jgi:N-formylglutamate deformylase
MQPYTLIQGSAPLLISLPHSGTHIPDAIKAGMTDTALVLEDTDWYVDRLYAFAESLGASIIKPLCSRYVIDLNRPPDNAELYPGANGTELCPTSTFAEQPLYREGCQPSEADVTARLTQYWQPYHQALAGELARIKEQHGLAVLFEGHSIRSVVPRLFAGRLPDFNIGTADGHSCSPQMTAAVDQLLAAQTRYSHVVNQRFKGGYITRQYGQPSENIHALQLELAQITYMQEQPPFAFEPSIAEQVSPLLQGLIAALLRWAQGQQATAPGE